MEYKAIAEKIVKKALKHGADEAEVYLSSDKEFELSVRNGDVENIKQATSKGLGLTVFTDKKLGFSYTSDFSEESLDDFAKKTVGLALVADSKPWNGLPDHEQKKMKDLDLYDQAIAEMPSEKKIALVQKVEKIALSADKRITKTDGGFLANFETEMLLVNSKGISCSSMRGGLYYGVYVIAGEGDDMQSGSWYSYKCHLKDLDLVENVAKTAAKRAVDRLGSRPVDTQKATVVYDRYATGSFWGGILYAMNGDSVFKKTTFLTDYLNKPIASELITIVDDPTVPRHVSSRPFDGEGKATQKNVIIDKGVLKMFFYNTITARKAGVDAETIATRYGYRSMPGAGYLNAIVKKGDTTREKIISGVKNGFYVTGLRGRGTDVPTGTYSCGASGFWIKDGEIAFPVDGVTLGGNALDILKNIEVLADDTDLRGSLSSPSFKVAEMTIGGKRS